MTLVIGETWLRASRDPFCSCQLFQHRWCCGDLGALGVGVLGTLGPGHLSGDERVVEASSICCLLCTAPQPPSTQGCGVLVLVERKGKSVVSCACKGPRGCVAVITAQLHFHRALLLISLSGGGGAPPLAREAGGVLPLNLLLLLLLPTLFPVVLPSSRLLDIPSLHGIPMLSLLAPAKEPRLPTGAAILTCCGVLHRLQRWREVPVALYMNKEGQRAGAEVGGVHQGSMWCLLHILVVGLPMLTPKVPANSQVTCTR